MDTAQKAIVALLVLAIMFSIFSLAISFGLFNLEVPVKEQRINIHNIQSVRDYGGASVGLSVEKLAGEEG